MQKTVLYDSHVNLKGKIVDFAGWALPVQYTSIINEHTHTRQKAGVFDIGHMGEFILEGEKSGELIDSLVTSNIASLGVGKCRYGLLTNETGGVIDDMITYRIEENKYMIVCNASRRQADFDWLKSHLLEGVTISDISDITSKIDLQGPLAFEVLKTALNIDATHLSYFQIETYKFETAEIIVSRTGYTGELGVEIYCPNNVAVNIWEKLVAHEDVLPVGLGARDTLRLEVGLALYGHELNEDTSPFESQLMRFVKLDKEFTGKQAVENSINNPEKILVPFVLDSKRSGREGMKIVNEEGAEIGFVTSGSVAPSLGYAIGFGFVKPEYNKVGAKIKIDTGRAALDAEVVELPFYKEGTARRKLTE